MTKLFTCLTVSLLLLSQSQAQGIKGILNKVTKKDSTGNSILTKTVGSTSGTGLSNDDIISGLKEALRVGTDSSSKKLGKADGYFADAAVKILMPAEAQKVEKTLRSIGMGSMVDKAILQINRGAEDAAGYAKPIFADKLRLTVAPVILWAKAKNQPDKFTYIEHYE